jgi:hypothetical protein
VRLACCQAEPDRETLPVDDRLDFGREPSPRATETMISTPFCGRSLLARPDGSAVDHLDVAVVSDRNGIHQPVPYTRFAPSHEAIVEGGAWAVAVGQIAPQRAECSTQKMPLSTRRSSTRGAPLGLFGSNGAITRHSKSVRS